MKNIFLLLFTILSCVTLKAQQITFTASANPVYANDASVTITAQGENNNLAVNMDVLPFYNGPAVMIAPNNQGYSGSFSVSNIARASYYSPTGSSKSSFTAKINTGGFSADATVKFTFAVTFVNVNNYSFSTGIVTLTVNTKPGSKPVITYYNTAIAGVFNRNDCGT